MINAWAGLVVFIVLTVAVVWWWWRSREPRAAPCRRPASAAGLTASSGSS